MREVVTFVLFLLNLVLRVSSKEVNEFKYPVLSDSFPSQGIGKVACIIYSCPCVWEFSSGVASRTVNYGLWSQKMILYYWSWLLYLFSCTCFLKERIWHMGEHDLMTVKTKKKWNRCLMSSCSFLVLSWITCLTACSVLSTF